MTDLRKIATAMGGEVRGKVACFPTPGHSKADRGSTAELVPSAPDGVLIRSYNGGDPLAIKDELRAKGVLGPWEYRRNGKPLYRKTRSDRPDGSKTYAFEHPDESGGWKPGRGVDPIPYRLDDLQASDGLIVMAEGEKQADRLASWGFIATSLKDWRAEFGQYVAGRTVVILPDNDQAGRDYADKAAAFLGAAGCTVRLIELAGLPPGGDIMDWDGDAAGLCKLIADAPPAKRGLAFRQGVSAAALMTKTFAPIRWIIPGYLPEGMALLAGAPKAGKSWLALGWMLAIASGGEALGSIPCEQGDVLGLMLEDNERRLQRRLRQMKLAGVPERLTLLTEWPSLDDGCCDEIEAWIAGVENPRLIVVDVFARVKGVKRPKEDDYSADYRQAAMLQSIASKHNLAIVVIHHTRKMAADDPFDEVSGTRGLTGAADSVLVLKRDAGTRQPVLYGRGRDLEEVESALEFDKETGRWFLLGAAWQVAATCERREIQQLLGRAVDPMTPSEIADRLGKSRQNIQKMLGKMLEDGTVEQVTRGRYVMVSMVSPAAAVPPEAKEPLETKETKDTTPHTHAREAHDPADCPQFAAGMILAPGECYCDPVEGFQ